MSFPNMARVWLTTSLQLTTYLRPRRMRLNSGFARVQATWVWCPIGFRFSGNLYQQQCLWHHDYSGAASEICVVVAGNRSWGGVGKALSLNTYMTVHVMSV